MARFILAFVAVMALAVAPPGVAAARAGCAQAMEQMTAAMDRSSSVAGDQGDAAKAPCCPHPSKGCAKACAAMSAAAAITPTGFERVTIYQTLAANGPAASPFSPSCEPSGFDPPPR
jgi:hypothetical protein